MSARISFFRLVVKYKLVGICTEQKKKRTFTVHRNKITQLHANSEKIAYSEIVSADKNSG